MGEDNIRLTSGDLYIYKDGKASFNIETVDDEPTDPVVNDFINALSNLEASFECTAKISEEAIMVLLGLRVAILSACPNKRVAYLADYARKKRTRKKNFHRAVKILERG